MSRAGPTAVALVSLATVLVAATGVRLRRPPARAGWLLLVAGSAAFAAGDVTALATRAGAGLAVADVVLVAGHPLIVAGLLLLRRPDRPGRDRVGLVDAALIAATAAMAYWVFVVAPGLAGGTGPLRLLLLTYLVLDVAVLAAAIRLVVTGPTRSVPTLIALAVTALLGTDVLAVRAGVVVRHDLSDPLQVGWLLSAALLAAAALHPDAARPVLSPAGPDEELSAVRLMLLGAVVLLPPALIGLLAAQREYADIPVLSAGLLVLVALVLARVGLLVRDVSATAARERTLRSAAAELVAAGDRPAIHAAALRAAERIAGRDLLACRTVDVGAVQAVEVVAGGGRHEARVRGRSLAARLLAQVERDRVPTVETLGADVLDALGLRGLQGRLMVLPVRVDGDLLALLVLVVAAPPDPGTVAALQTLVAQLTLALESATVAADRHLRQSEARFRALVQNSSDAILLVDQDARVTYQSPSSDRMFGYPPGTLVGHSVDHLCHPDDLLRVQAGLTEVLATPGASRRLELRFRRHGGGWLDAEAVVDNLQADPNVRAGVVTVRDVSERKRFEDQLTHQAFHDELTGLANRALFTDRVAHALARRERDGTLLAVLLLDLDDFKTVNDGLGHAAGDSLLRAVAERLSGLVRPGDTTARLGGDEFAMVLVDLPSEEAAVHAVERIISVLGQPLLIEGREVFVQASIGLAFAAEGPVSPDEVLRNADAAMYVVKADGKGRYAVYQPHMHAAAVSRLDLRADLQRALDNDEFALHYQPIVAMSSGLVVGLEALVRWRHPQRGLVLPDSFIPLAEETGLVVPLGRWVLERACREVAAWSLQTPGLSVSINVSQRQLRRMDFGAEVGDVLALTGVEPSRIALEITESAIMADVESTIERLHALKALGVRVAVDDFGTGYSSFSWLRQLPVDVLKIDREFVAELGQRDQGGFLVGAIIELAHNLGLRTVAEGIERQTQVARLQDLRCDLGQGYHVGRPMPAEDVVDLLARQQPLPAAGTGWAS